MTGAKLVIDTLRAAGVDTVFSLSGNQIMPLYDACIDAGVRIVHVRHEAAAVHMADAWAQLTGCIGVALLTAGPGLVNGLAPLFAARHAESPVLLVSGDSPLDADGTGAFQELALTQVTAPLVKQARRALKAGDLVREVGQAIETALSGRPGPVHLAVPFDLLRREVPVQRGAAGFPQVRRITPLARADAEDIVRRIARARAPVLLAGPLLNRSRAAGLTELAARALAAPVVAMESPRGLRDPALGTFSTVLAEADLVVLVGKVPDFSLGVGGTLPFGADAEVVAIDPEAAMLERARRLFGSRLRLAVRADADAALRTLAERALPAGRGEWLRRVDASLRRRTLLDERPAQAGIGPQDICAAVQKAIDGAREPILICDGGEFGQWAQALCTAPSRLINGLSGSIGGGLCHAIAARLARPHAGVFLMSGDGSAGFHLAEFETAARENAPFVAVVGNDARWNAEHQIQLRDYGPERLIGCQLSRAARYDLAAAGLGGHGAHVTTAADLDEALVAAVASGLPACVNVDMAGLPAPVFVDRGQGAAPPRGPGGHP
ncbi:thiamine pyrophosphate-binding protein [Pseudothauera nasutitermitis]|uniref:Thiamine pyrophosphate-binding protein n=1 Tax=Pseudothauera nasutitermitis TaxID=2565930 RepID=A0A4S4AZL2_9RHOO|nr:thiamine pyrophosphate-binding protein [Pseudothauera nasutitermitis]THF65486.1 thiamine pyrophosphate-binding protein [Pseudothauera nasutitermitis]